MGESNKQKNEQFGEQPPVKILQRNGTRKFFYPDCCNYIQDIIYFGVDLQNMSIIKEG